MKHYLKVLLLAVAWSVSLGESDFGVTPAAVCTTAAACQLVPNAAAMVCTGGMCIPQCSPGFNLVGVACISGASVGSPDE